MSRACLVTAFLAAAPFAVLVAAPGAAHAQIVNVQGALAKPPAKDGETGTIQAKLDWREGNNPLFDIGGGGDIVIRRGSVLGLALARGEYGRSAGITLTRKTFEHLRTRVELDDLWRWEAFAQHEFDQFRRLSLRALVGTGPALQVLNDKELAVLVGAAYIFEYERLDHRDGVSDSGAHSTDHRASIYITGHEDLSSGVAIVETYYIQPRLDAPSDLRMLGELAVQSKLTGHIALKDGFTVAYDRTPPQGVKRYDTSLEISLIVTF